MNKQITEQEALFRKLVSDLICNKKISLREKEQRLINFLHQADFYYDVFCESVYSLMTDDSIETISLDDSGYTRFNIIAFDDFYAGFELLSKKDIVNPNDDIIVYIKIALERLQYRLLKNKCSAHQYLKFIEL